MYYYICWSLFYFTISVFDFVFTYLLTTVLYHHFSIRFCIDIYADHCIISPFQYSILYLYIYVECWSLYYITISVFDFVLICMLITLFYHHFSIRFCIDIFAVHCIISPFQYPILYWYICSSLYYITISINFVLIYMLATVVICMLYIVQDLVEESEDDTRFDDISDSQPPIELPAGELSKLEEISELVSSCLSSPLRLVSSPLRLISSPLR